MFPFVTVFNDLEHIKIKELSDFQRLQIAKVKKKNTIAAISSKQPLSSMLKC